MVFVRHRPGIYDTWEEAEVQVNGYSRGLKKRYKTMDEAEIALLNFHTKSFRVKDMQSAHTSDGPSTSAAASDNKIWFLVFFFLGFLACILLAFFLDSEWSISQHYGNWTVYWNANIIMRVVYWSKYNFFRTYDGYESLKH